MVDYTRLQATAQRLIQASGRNVQLVDPAGNATPSDPTKPWRGVTNGRTDANAPKTTVRGVFVALSGTSDLGEELASAGITLDSDSRKYLMYSPADLDPGQNPRQFVEIVDGGETFRSSNTQVLKPGDIDLLVFMEVEA